MMTSRERMIAAFEGRPVDRLPVAPYIWGAEYVWKLMGKPIWEVMHGEGDMGKAILQAIDARHQCDWVIPLHASSGALHGKSFVREDQTQVYFTDDLSGEQFVFHKEGHWLISSHDIGKARVDHQAAHAHPPANKAEADDWLRRVRPGIFDEPAPCFPQRELREQYPDRFLCGSTPAPFAELAYGLGFEPTMLMLHETPKLCAYMIETMLSHLPSHCQNLASEGYDGAMMVDSWASADVMSPDTYKNWIAPLHKLVSDELHRVGLKSVMYNTGNVMPLLPAISATGFDALSFEERIKGLEMDIAEIRAGLGPDICLFGNFDSYLLLRGDHEAIQREVRRQVGSAGPRSFVMGTGSPICDHTDPAIVDFWINEVRSASVG